MYISGSALLLVTCDGVATTARNKVKYSQKTLPPNTTPPRNTGIAGSKAEADQPGDQALTCALQVNYSPRLLILAGMWTNTAAATLAG